MSFIKIKSQPYKHFFVTNQEGSNITLKSLSGQVIYEITDHIIDDGQDASTPYQFLSGILYSQFCENSSDLLHIPSYEGKKLIFGSIRKFNKKILSRGGGLLKKICEFSEFFSYKTIVIGKLERPKDNPTYEKRVFFYSMSPNGKDDFKATLISDNYIEEHLQSSNLIVFLLEDKSPKDKSSLTNEWQSIQSRDGSIDPFDVELIEKLMSISSLVLLEKTLHNDKNLMNLIEQKASFLKDEVDDERLRFYVLKSTNTNRGDQQIVDIGQKYKVNKILQSKEIIDFILNEFILNNFSQKEEELIFFDREYNLLWKNLNHSISIPTSNLTSLRLFSILRNRDSSLSYPLDSLILSPLFRMISCLENSQLSVCHAKEIEVLDWVKPEDIQHINHDQIAVVKFSETQINICLIKFEDLIQLVLSKIRTVEYPWMYLNKLNSRDLDFIQSLKRQAMSCFILVFEDEDHICQEVVDHLDFLLG